MNLQSSADLLDDILFRAGEKTDGSSDYEAQALVYLNRAYRTLYLGGAEFSPKFHESWYWANENQAGRGVLSAVVKTGVAAVIAGSSSVTITPAPLPDVTGYMFRAEGDEEMLEISAQVGETLSLQFPYTGASGVKPFRLMRFRYPLPLDAIKPASPLYFYRDGGRRCDLVDYRDILAFHCSGATLAGVPGRFALIEETSLLFDRYGSDLEGERMIYEMEYRARPADLANSPTEEPIVPRQWRHVLADLALYFIFLDKDDSRTAVIAKQVTAALEAMKVENRALLAQAGEPAHLYPRGRRDARRLTTSSGKLIGYYR